MYFLIVLNSASTYTVVIYRTHLEKSTREVATRDHVGLAGGDDVPRGQPPACIVGLVGVDCHFGL